MKSLHGALQQKPFAKKSTDWGQACQSQRAHSKGGHRQRHLVPDAIELADIFPACFYINGAGAKKQRDLHCCVSSNVEQSPTS